MYGFDTQRLISLVKERPALWDKSRRTGGRAQTQSLWADVWRHLDDRYDTWTNDERDEYGRMVLKKWKNIKDQFIKTLKRRRANILDKSGRPFKYVYQGQLSFLVGALKNPEDYDHQPWELEDLRQQQEQQQDQNDATDIPRVKPASRRRRRHNGSSTVPSSSKNKRTTMTLPLPLPLPPPEELQPPKQQHYDQQDILIQPAPSVVEESRHVTFFNSLLSSLRGFNEDETLELQSGVIGVIQNIRRARACSCSSSSATSGMFSDRTLAPPAFALGLRDNPQRPASQTSKRPRSTTTHSRIDDSTTQTSAAAIFPKMLLHSPSHIPTSINESSDHPSGSDPLGVLIEMAGHEGEDEGGEDGQNSYTEQSEDEGLASGEPESLASTEYD